MYRLVIVFIICMLIFTGCSTTTPSPIIMRRQNTVYQIATTHSLLSKIYNSNITCDTLLRYGDFGAGLFNELDGEMIILDDKLYQFKTNGIAYTPEPEEIKTPFATVCKFHADKTIDIKEHIIYSDFKKMIDSIAQSDDRIYAIKINGTFTNLQLRAISKQEKPYPPIKYITQSEEIFTIPYIKGTILGFRNPEYTKGMLVAGFYLHFISEDRKHGGHVVDFKTVSATCNLDFIDQVNIFLPNTTTNRQNKLPKK